MEYLWQVLLRAVEPGDTPLSCEECFVLFDYLSDLLASGYDAADVLSLAEPYLRRCPDCHQELQREVADLVLTRPEPSLGQISSPGRQPSS